MLTLFLYYADAVALIANKMGCMQTWMCDLCYNGGNGEEDRWYLVYKHKVVVFIPMKQYPCKPEVSSSSTVKNSTEGKLKRKALMVSCQGVTVVQ